MESLSILNSQTVSFSKLGKDFQEKLAFLILDDRVFSDRMSEVLDVQYLESKHLQEFVKKIFNYKKKYGTHPSYNTMETILRTELDLETDDALQKQIRDFYARSIANGSNIIESAEFIKEKALDFCRKQKLREAMIKSVGLIKNSSFDEVAKVINDALVLGADSEVGHDYIKDFELRYTEKGRQTVSTGWTSFDQITQGGHGKGELGVIIAGTGVGKSQVLVHFGATALKMGMNVVYYTLELKDTVIAQRFDSCISGINLNDLQDKKQEIFKQIESIEGNLVIKEFPTKTASTNTIRSHLEKLKQQNFIPDVILIDYADLLRPISNRREKRDELESIYEEIRAIAQETNTSCWTASQTNRTGMDSEIVTMNSISEAFSKCFIADFIFTISRTIEDRQCNQGRFYVAKNRNGPDGMVFSIFMDTSNINIKIIGKYDPEKHFSSSPEERLKQKYAEHKGKSGSKIINGTTA